MGVVSIDLTAGKENTPEEGRENSVKNSAPGGKTQRRNKGNTANKGGNLGKTLQKKRGQP